MRLVDADGTVLGVVPIDEALQKAEDRGLDLVEVAAKQIPEVWINPGADSPAVLQRARDLGIEPIVACSLMALGATL